MSYNIVENGKLKSITSSGMLIEGKPIYGERKQYDTNKKMPLAGQAALKYTMDRDGILTGSCHKAGQGYSAWMHMNGKILTTFDNYGGESCSFDFPNVRVKAGDVIELTTNVPTTETTNFFWLNNIGVTPIVGMEPGGEIEVSSVTKTITVTFADWFAQVTPEQLGVTDPTQYIWSVRSPHWEQIIYIDHVKSDFVQLRAWEISDSSSDAKTYLKKEGEIASIEFNGIKK